MIHLRTDQYTHMTRDCPISIDIDPVDDLVEIALGEHHIGGDTLRLIIDHPDTCLRLVEALHNSRNKLLEHLHAKADPNPTTSQLDKILASPAATEHKRTA